MKFLDLLAKLGILRFGTKKALYHSAKDMPAEFLMNDIINADRDLTTAKDLKNAFHAVTGSKGSSPAQAICDQCNQPVRTEQKYCTACGAKLKN